MYTFIGKRGSNEREFVTNDGFILPFKKDLQLAKDCMYVINCKVEDYLYIPIKISLLAQMQRSEI